MIHFFLLPFHRCRLHHEFQLVHDPGGDRGQSGASLCPGLSGDGHLCLHHQATKTEQEPWFWHGDVAGPVGLPHRGPILGRYKAHINAGTCVGSLCRRIVLSALLRRRHVSGVRLKKVLVSDTLPIPATKGS